MSLLKSSKLDLRLKLTMSAKEQGKILSEGTIKLCVQRVEEEKEEKEEDEKNEEEKGEEEKAGGEEKEEKGKIDQPKNVYIHLIDETFYLQVHKKTVSAYDLFEASYLLRPYEVSREELLANISLGVAADITGELGGGMMGEEKATSRADLKPNFFDLGYRFPGGIYLFLLKSGSSREFFLQRALESESSTDDIIRIFSLSEMLDLTRKQKNEKLADFWSTFADLASPTFECSPRTHPLSTRQCLHVPVMGRLGTFRRRDDCRWCKEYTTETCAHCGEKVRYLNCYC